MQIIKGQQISAGNFIVSIGSFTTTEVAIFSKSSGKFVELKMTKRSKKLKKIKRKFKTWLNSESTFTFSHFTPEKVGELVTELKSKK